MFFFSLLHLKQEERKSSESTTSRDFHHVNKSSAVWDKSIIYHSPDLRHVELIHVIWLYIFEGANIRGGRDSRLYFMPLREMRIYFQHPKYAVDIGFSSFTIMVNNRNGMAIISHKVRSIWNIDSDSSQDLFRFFHSDGKFMFKSFNIFIALWSIFNLKSFAGRRTFKIIFRFLSSLRKCGMSKYHLD